MASLLGISADLKRRGVYRIAVIYGVTAWAITEVAVSVEEPLRLPDWLDTSIIVVLGLGFPIALVLAYAFNLTPEGIKPDRGKESEGVASAAAAGTPILSWSSLLRQQSGSSPGGISG